MSSASHRVPVSAGAAIRRVLGLTLIFTLPAPYALAEFATAGEPWREDLVQALPVPSAEQEAHWENTLAGVYELALRNDRTLAAAQATFRAGLEERRLGRAGLLPEITASFTYQDAFSEARGQFPVGGQLVPNFTDTDRETKRWSINLEQPLFDLPAWFRFRRGQELSEQARANFTVAQQDLMVRTTAAYFDVLRAMANLQASLAQEAALRGQLEQVEQRFEVGLVAITDVFEARAASDIATADRLGFEGDVEIALENLSVITGRSHSHLWQLSESFPVVDPTPDQMEAWVDFARRHNADIQLARFARQVAEQDSRVASSEHLPKANVTFSYTDTDSDLVRENISEDEPRRPFISDGTDRVVSLNVSVPVFAGGAISANRRRAAAQYDSESQRYEATVRQVTQNTRALHVSVRRNVARTRARAQAIVSSRSALEAAETGYEVGTRNIVDVLDAQRTLFSAIRDQSNSIIDFVLDVIDLKRQAGLLTPADLLELNRWLEEPPPATVPPRPRRSDGE